MNKYTYKYRLQYLSVYKVLQVSPAFILKGAILLCIFGGKYMQTFTH